MNKLAFCSLEVSALAKELGFNWESDFDYYYTSGNPVPQPFLYLEIGYGTDILAPTQQLLVQWLRDLHDLHIIINCFERLKTTHFDYLIQELQTFNLIINAGESDNYEETLEQAINKCLLIVKDKNGNKTK